MPATTIYVYICSFLVFVLGLIDVYGSTYEYCSYHRKEMGDELDAAFNCDCDCDCSCNYDCGSGCGFGCGCLWCLGFVCAAKYATAAGFVHGSQQMN